MTDDAHTPYLVWADDQPELTLAARVELEKRGFKVLPVSDGQSAVDVLEVRIPDGFLVDLQMPPGEVGGIWLVRALRARHRLTIPILVISGKGTKAQAVQAVKEGADDFVDRDDAALVERIVSLVEGHKDTALDALCELTRRELDDFERQIRHALASAYEKNHAQRALGVVLADIRAGMRPEDFKKYEEALVGCTSPLAAFERIPLGSLGSIFLTHWAWFSSSLQKRRFDRGSFEWAFQRSIRVRNDLAHGRPSQEMELLRTRVLMFDVVNCLFP